MMAIEELARAREMLRRALQLRAEGEDEAPRATGLAMLLPASLRAWLRPCDDCPGAGRTKERP